MAKEKRAVHMKKLSDGARELLEFIRDNPGCSPSDVLAYGQSLSRGNTELDSHARRSRLLAVGSQAGLLTLAGMVRREDDPRRFWITKKGRDALS